MRSADSRFIRTVVWLLLAASVAGFAIIPLTLEASGPMQGDAVVDISETECAFWLDFDGDGEGDEAVEIHPDKYIRQEMPVVGGCEVRLNTQEEATLVLVSELTDWSSEVEVIQEPGMPRPFTLHPGKNEIAGLQGSMRIEVNHTGVTPRSVKLRTLRDGYEHQVQVPRPFRLLEVTIITPDGRLDRLEESVQSASAAYISAHQLVFGSRFAPDATGQSEVVALANALLEQGYPQIASDVLALESGSVGGGVSAMWMWTAIALAVVVLALIAGAIAVVLASKRNLPEGAERRSTGLRRNNM
ncbi:MAG: hypothetical protein OXF79_25255 [Chloroflexi bacterium]|nr:hypothetical protein [Chloroflexota bacterium]